MTGGKFEPKKPVELDPPKLDVKISKDELAKATGIFLLSFFLCSHVPFIIQATQATNTCNSKASTAANAMLL